MQKWDLLNTISFNQIIMSNINKIIRKKLRGKLTSGEEIVFEKWIAESSANKKLYYSLFSLKGKGSDIERILTIDNDKAWSSVLKVKNSGFLSKTKVFSLLSVMKYAASIAVMLSVGYYMSKNISFQNIMNTMDTRTDSSFIEPDLVNSNVFASAGVEESFLESIKIALNESDAAGSKYNTLHVPNGKSLDFILPDGTKVELNPGSSILYPLNFENNKEINVYLEGEAFFEISEGVASLFIVRTENITVSSSMAKFNVNSYSNNSRSSVSIFEGTVKTFPSINNSSSKNSIFLKSNQRASLGRNSISFYVEDTQSEHLANSYASGGLKFNDASFKDVLNQIERHYNITVNCDPLVLKNYLFTASLEKTSLENVLRKIQEFKHFKYHIIGNELIVEDSRLFS